jgi:hypothetical protein
VLATHPAPKTPEKVTEFLAHYRPLKFGSSLTTRLNKKDKDGRSYWEQGDADDVPFLLAIPDLRLSGSEVSEGERGSMIHASAALWPYLYGRRVEWR